MGVRDAVDPKAGDGAFTITVPFTIRRRGVETKLVIASPGADNPKPDPQLCRLIARARLWFDQLSSGDLSSVRSIAQRDGVHETEVTRALPLAFLAPAIVEAVLDGRQPEGLTATRLKRLSSLPVDWDDQCRRLEIPF